MIDGMTIVALLFLAGVIAYRLYSRPNREQHTDHVCTGSHCKLPDCAETSVKVPPLKPRPPRVRESEAQLEARMERLLSQFKFGQGEFLIEPYLQLGSSGPNQFFEILWAIVESDKRQCKLVIDPALARVNLGTRVIAIEGIPTHTLYYAQVSGFTPGTKIPYSVELDGKPAFNAVAFAPVSPLSTKQRFVVVGDMGEGSEGQKAIAHHIWQAQPSLVAITGDIVYSRGRVKEFLARFFPIYNSSRPTRDEGAPILRSVISFSSGGNHCFGRRRSDTQDTFDDYADLYAYFLYLSMPLNGPKQMGAATSVPVLQGTSKRVQAFLAGAGNRYPNQANYSFDWGSAHWLVLDANGYMNWSEQELRDWVEADLAASKANPNCVWRFVNLHQPPFTSQPKHKLEKEIRKLCDLFQKYGVNVVFGGHSHWYERSFPLRYDATRQDGDGNIGLDLNFDGQTRRVPKGVIYIVSGAGGAQLNYGRVAQDPSKWEPFTRTIVADRHSFTLCDIDGKTLTIQQIDDEWSVVDHIVIEKL